MTVKIVMERTVEADKQGELLDLLRQLRTRAVVQPGYVSGETLTSIDRAGTHLVISTWHSLHDWRAWENHPQRLEILAKVEALLIAPPKISIYAESWASLPEGV